MNSNANPKSRGRPPKTALETAIENALHEVAEDVEDLADVAGANLRDQETDKGVKRTAEQRDTEGAVDDGDAQSGSPAKRQKVASDAVTGAVAPANAADAINFMEFILEEADGSLRNMATLTGVTPALLHASFTFVAAQHMITEAKSMKDCIELLAMRYPWFGSMAALRQTTFVTDAIRVVCPAFNLPFVTPFVTASPAGNSLGQPTPTLTTTRMDSLQQKLLERIDRDRQRLSFPTPTPVALTALKNMPPSGSMKQPASPLILGGAKIADGPVKVYPRTDGDWLLILAGLHTYCMRKLACSESKSQWPAVSNILLWRQMDNHSFEFTERRALAEWGRITEKTFQNILTRHFVTGTFKMLLLVCGPSQLADTPEFFWIDKNARAYLAFSLSGDELFEACPLGKPLQAAPTLLRFDEKKKV